METSNGMPRLFSLSTFMFLFTLVSVFSASASFAKTTYYPPKHKYSYKGETVPGKSYKEMNIACPNCSMLRLFASAMGGGAWARLGQSETFIDDATTYKYTPDNSTQGRGAWGAGVGAELQVPNSYAIQAGLSYYQTQAFNATGTVTQGVDPAATNAYRYSYGITARQYLIETKFLGDMSCGLHPYLTLGVGASFNSVKDYDVSVNSPFPFSTFTPEYAAYTNISFSYAVGIGIDYDILKFARLGMGYRYAGFGHANLGNGEINTVDINHDLGQTNLNASMAMLQLTFLI